MSSPASYGAALPAVVVERWERERRETAEALRTRFEAATHARDLVAEWRAVECVGGDAARCVVGTANTADLLVVAQECEPRHRVGRGETISRVLAGSGRPVLICPPERLEPAVGRRVLAAWDGQGASTRALFGALPLMQDADAVRLQRFDPPATDRHRVLGITEELGNTLARHGIAIEVFTAAAPDGELADDLLGIGADWGADVIVAGGYGRGVLRETLFGSTTRRLLERGTVPLLMCH